MHKSIVCLFVKNSEQKMSSLYEEWRTIEHDLLRERGLWGFEDADPLAKYKLDFIEGPCRMRKRMVLNEDFYKHYPYRANIESIVNRFLFLKKQTLFSVFKKRKFNPPVSFDSKQQFDRQSYIVDRLLHTNVPKETIEIAPIEPIIREEGETWTNDEG